jgi:hypothetical protein
MALVDYTNDADGLVRFTRSHPNIASETHYIMSSGAGPAGTINDAEQQTPISPEETARLLHLRDAAFEIHAVRQSRPKPTNQTQPYFDEITPSYTQQVGADFGEYTELAVR